MTVVIRGPEGTVGATIERYADGAWKPLKTEETGSAAQYLAVVTEFGVFTLVAPGPGGPYPTATASGSGPSASSNTSASPPSTSVVAIGSPGSVAPTVSPAPPVSPSTNGGGPPLGAVVVGFLVLERLAGEALAHGGVS